MIMPRPPMKIGELLVESGVMTAEQVDHVLREQHRTHRPFGDLAERLFGIDPKCVEQAWVEQYLTYDTVGDLDSERVDDAALRVITRRQAWQFHIVPLRYEHGHLLAATTRKHLRRAVSFAWSGLSDPVCFLVVEQDQLERFLQSHYPWSTPVPRIWSNLVYGG